MTGTMEMEDWEKNGMDLDHKSNGDGMNGTDKPYDFAEPEYLNEEVTGFMKHVETVQNGISTFMTDNQKWINMGILIALVLGYHAWMVIATIHDANKASPMLVITGIAWFLFIYYYLVKPYLGDTFYFQVFQPAGVIVDKYGKYTVVQIAFSLLLVGAIAAFIIVDTRNDRSRLIGLGGMATFIVLMYILSNNRTKIRWRPVIGGFFLQFCLGLLVLRWPWGSAKFNWISDQIVKFLDYTNAGSEFVYGFLAAPPNICGMSGVFAFTSMQVVIFFGSVVSLLYYYGIIQAILRVMGWFVQSTLGTTATESLNACACIFLGQSEAPLLIKPYLEKMTPSEIHAVMTSGFSCIAGSLFAAYIAFGACPTYLLSATVMSACGSLACSKILYPETEESQLKNVEDLELPKGEESNPLECISNGAVAAVELVLAIVANLIVFLAILSFIDNVFAYAGELIGHDGWSFQLAMGYLFYPLAYVMGVTVNSDETLKVAQLMGTKTTLNEFIAYQNLGKMVQAKQLSPRSAMIATYALCGFSNFSSIGIQLGVLGGMCPSRKQVFAKVVLRALMAGCISCFFTACVAGILVEEPIHCAPASGKAHCFDVDQYTTTLAPSTGTTTLSSLLGHTEL